MGSWIKVREIEIQKTRERKNEELKPKESVFFENLRWLDAHEAAVYLRLPSVGALRNLVYRRQIPFTKLGRCLRFNKQELDRHLESLTTRRSFL